MIDNNVGLRLSQVCILGHLLLVDVPYISNTILATCDGLQLPLLPVSFIGFRVYGKKG